jgi:hypothetical protein
VNCCRPRADAYDARRGAKSRADYPLAPWTLRTLMVAFVMEQLSGVGTASLRSRGRVRLELLTGGLTVLLRALLLLPLFWLWGYEGFVIATSAAGVLAILWFAWAFCRGPGTAGHDTSTATPLEPIRGVLPQCRGSHTKIGMSRLVRVRYCA